MRGQAGLAMVVAAVIAGCGGDAFTAAPSDGGVSADGMVGDATGGGDASTMDGSIADGGASDAVTSDTGTVDATPCTATCPTGFHCAGALCTDDAANRFSPTQNPKGNWTYGWSASLASTFTPYLLHSTVQGTLALWDVTADSLKPSVFSNTANATTVYSGTFSMKAGELGLYPGANNEHSIVRWTAPATGRYAIDAAFSGLSGAGGAELTTVSVTILLNGSVVLGQTINTNGGANIVPYTSAHNQLAAGGVIDFVVDYGNDGNADNDPTGLRALITAE